MEKEIITKTATLCGIRAQTSRALLPSITMQIQMVEIYWASSQYYAEGAKAWRLTFSNTALDNALRVESKTSTYKVRVIRAF